MLPTFRRPPPGATDVLAKLAPWWPSTGFAAGRDQFSSPGQPLDTARLGPPLTRTTLRDGTPLAIYRSRLAEANEYVRVRPITSHVPFQTLHASLLSATAAVVILGHCAEVICPLKVARAG